MAEEIQQLIKMVANLRTTMLDKFEGVENRLDSIDDQLVELNETQIKILNTMKIYEDDINNNRKHIERLENKHKNT